MTCTEAPQSVYERGDSAAGPNRWGGMRSAKRAATVTECPCCTRLPARRWRYACVPPMIGQMVDLTRPTFMKRLPHTHSFFRHSFEPSVLLAGGPKNEGFQCLALIDAAGGNQSLAN